MLIEVLKSIDDVRDPQARQYLLWEILLIYVLTLLSGGKSYADIKRFGDIHFDTLKRMFNLKMKRMPHMTQIRLILLGVDPADFERAFRTYSQYLAPAEATHHICFDGKSLRGSTNQKGHQVNLFTAFEAQDCIVLGHIVLEDKESEIPALQAFLSEISVKGKVITADAMHCQKKL